MVSVVGVMVVAPVVVVSFVVVATLVKVVVVVHRSRYYMWVVVESAVSVPVKAQVVETQFELLRHERDSSEWKWKHC